MHHSSQERSELEITYLGDNEVEIAIDEIDLGGGYRGMPVSLEELPVLNGQVVEVILKNSRRRVIVTLTLSELDSFTCK